MGNALFEKGREGFLDGTGYACAGTYSANRRFAETATVRKGKTHE
jgi:hypothetical protein